LGGINIPTSGIATFRTSMGTGTESLRNSMTAVCTVLAGILRRHWNDQLAKHLTKIL